MYYLPDNRGSFTWYISIVFFTILLAPSGKVKKNSKSFSTQ